MDIMADQFPSLATALVEQAKKDLISEDDHFAMRAAMYFFLCPVSGDEGDLKTFTGLCRARNINADAAAKAIFNQLLPHEQKRVRSLLQASGYHVQSEASLSITTE